jgi:hypothetical protein
MACMVSRRHRWTPSTPRVRHDPEAQLSGLPTCRDSPLGSEPVQQRGVGDATCAPEVYHRELARAQEPGTPLRTDTHSPQHFGEGIRGGGTGRSRGQSCGRADRDVRKRGRLDGCAIAGGSPRRCGRCDPRDRSAPPSRDPWVDPGATERTTDAHFYHTAEVMSTGAACRICEPSRQLGRVSAEGSKRFSGRAVSARWPPTPETRFRAEPAPVA